MNEQLENKLVNKYKSFFTINQHIESGQPFYPIAFGFECGDGWYTILENLLEKINNIQNKFNINNPSEKMDIKITQIKEKYGGLRFYMGGATTEIFNLIDEAEDLSYKTCETCGSIEDIGQTEGWVVTICKKCIEKQENSAYLLQTWRPNEEE